MFDLREVTSRLRPAWQQVPPTQRLVLLILPVAGLFATAVWWSPLRVRPMEILLEGDQLSDIQLSKAVQAFDKANLAGYCLREKQLYVPRGQRAHYLAALVDSGVLQQDLHQYTAEALRSSKFLETESARRQRVLHACERDLAYAIGQMEGVEKAFVKIDENQERGLQQRLLTSASVGVVPEKGQTLNAQQIVTIRTLVASSKAGLAPSDVHITDLRSGRVCSGDDTDLATWVAVEEHLRFKKSLERDWQLKLRRVLHFVPPAEVTLEIELESPPEKFGMSTGDEPSSIALSALTPRRFHVSVGVPRSYLVGAWRARQPIAVHGAAGEPTDKQLAQLQEDTAERIRHAVLGLLPQGSNAPSSTVTVTPFDDPPPQTANSQPSQPAGTWSLRQKWGVVTLLLGLCCLIVVQLGWKHTLGRPGPASSRGGAFPEDLAKEDDLTATHSLPYPDAEEQQLRATLTDLVRKDPDQAARILNRWIARAG
jgi:flagellar biosynthesis/type III secretory pathway M-ring protein FliF/YscJ